MDAKTLGEMRVYPDDVNQGQLGITLRQHFAGLAMQGLCARPADHMPEYLIPEAIRMANALLVALASPETNATEERK